MHAIFPKCIGPWDRYVGHLRDVDLSSIFLVAKHSLEVDPLARPLRVRFPGYTMVFFK